MHNIRLGGEDSQLWTPIGFADTVLDVGKGFLEFLAARGR
jgi:hypothetical protein